MQDQVFIDKKKDSSKFFHKEIGSFIGLGLIVFLGFGFYFLLNKIQITSNWLSYDFIVKNVNTNVFYKVIWAIKDFTEPQFYAGVFASLGVILGGIIAWRLDVRKSRFSGFDICYGSNMFPWILASQLISLTLTIFVFNFTSHFSTGEYSWLPTFITIVGVPPSLMLIYGPSYKSLFTVSILGALVSFPTAFFIMTKINPLFDLPGVVGNVLTMAITGIVIGQVCKVLPWMENVPLKLIDKSDKEVTEEDQVKKMSTPTWFVRRVLADFSEAQFYGNEVASIFLILGVCIDWILNNAHGASGSGAIPAIILSQFIASGVGVFLYFDKFVEKGWYATYVPVVSVGPACVLMFGATIPVALFAGALGGIIGAPVAEYFTNKLPSYIHGTVGNVMSMALCTMIVAIVIEALPWF